jgi:hypothetical protein
MTGSFTIGTKIVSQNTQATIGATFGSSNQQASLTVDVTSLEAIAVKPTAVVGKATTVVTGAVEITGPAPTGGVVVTLTSSDPAAASMPATVTIAAGQTQRTFTVKHSPVNKQITVTLSASYGGTVKTTTLVVGT